MRHKNTGKALSVSDQCVCFFFFLIKCVGVPLLHLDVVPAWFSASCWWSGQRSICQITGSDTQPR